MEKDSRVALVREPGLVGTITEVDKRNVADIDFEGGGHGRFPITDLKPVDAATPNKGWPPPNYETKIAAP